MLAQHRVNVKWWRDNKESQRVFVKYLRQVLRSETSCFPSRSLPPRTPTRTGGDGTDTTTTTPAAYHVLKTALREIFVHPRKFFVITDPGWT